MDSVRRCARRRPDERSPGTGASRSRRVWRLSASAAAVLLAMGLTVPGAPAQGSGPAHAQSATAAMPAARLNWTPCPFPGSPPALECASVPVPLDYAHPDGAITTVTVDRLKAADPAQRIGSLFFNPGGPGGSGTAIVYAQSLGANLFTARARQRFDLIGIDPRGVGLSNAVRCDPALLNRHVSQFPADEAGFRRLVERNRALGASCRRLTGPLLEHVDTASAARDLDAIRRALGEDRINYLGLSYGVQLGTQYAELFPTHIRTMALDAALVHSLPTVSLFADEARAYEDSLNRFFRWCARATSCALHGRRVGHLFDRLVATAGRRPIPAPGCAASVCRSRVTGEDIRFQAQLKLLFKKPTPQVAPDGWNALAIAMKKALAGDATAFSPPLARSPADDALNGSAIAIECLDWPDPVRSLSDLKRLQLLGRVVAPRLRGASQSWTVLAGCIGWPAPVVNPPHPTDVAGTPPILIINATHDPSTPYVWAQQLAAELGSAVLLTRAGDGHTSYLAKGPSRTRDAIDRYLITGQTPPPNTVYTT